MRAVLLEAPASLLEERRRTGADRFDEIWEGVLHMVPPPTTGHQRLGSDLLLVLAPIAKSKGLVPLYEAGVFRPTAGVMDYRTPDLVFARPEALSDRGVEGRAELIVEIRSPNDETDEKLPFYAEVGVSEVVAVDPITRRVELFENRDGRMHRRGPDAAGEIRCDALGVSFSVADGPKLRIRWPGAVAEI